MMIIVNVYKTVFRDYPDVMTVTQMSKALGICTKTAYELLHTNEIAYIKIGRNYKIPKKNVIDYLNISAKKNL